MAFATVSDIEARWRVLSDEETSRASVLLDDASAMLSALVAVDESDAGQRELLRSVCCSMVIRAMAATSADIYGVSQASMTAGAYTQSWSYSNPSGDMYLTKMEKKLLGIGAGYIGSIRAKIGGCHD